MKRSILSTLLLTLLLGACGGQSASLSEDSRGGFDGGSFSSSLSPLFPTISDPDSGEKTGGALYANVEGASFDAIFSTCTLAQSFTATNPQFIHHLESEALEEVVDIVTTQITSVDSTENTTPNYASIPIADVVNTLAGKIWYQGETLPEQENPYGILTSFRQDYFQFNYSYEIHGQRFTSAYFAPGLFECFVNVKPVYSVDPSNGSLVTLTLVQQSSGCRPVPNPLDCD